MINLEKLREENDLLKKDVAKIIEVSESVYCEWENEKLTIPTKRIYQLANLFEVNIDYMLGISNTRLHIKSEKEINLQIVSTRLKEIRKSLNMSMRDLAKMLNTSSSAISNYENYKYLILSPFLIEICKYSNYSIDWVLDRTNIKYLGNK